MIHEVLIPFSKRFEKALQEGTIDVVLSDRVRGRVRHLLADCDAPMVHQPNRYDHLKRTTSASKEAAKDLMRHYGVETFLFVGEDGEECWTSKLLTYIHRCPDPQVFDIIQCWDQYLSSEEQLEVQRKLNDILEQENTGWILCDGQFYRIDSQFLSESVLNRVCELLDTQDYRGPLDEFERAREHLQAANYREAIHCASSAFESLMKIIENQNERTANSLIQGLREIGFYRGMPEDIEKHFGEKVLSGVPFLRNKLGGHGQGMDVVVPPREFAELTVHLAGSLLVFLIRRKLALAPPEVLSPPEEPPKAEDSEMASTDDLPF